MRLRMLSSNAGARATGSTKSTTCAPGFSGSVITPPRTCSAAPGRAGSGHSREKRSCSCETFQAQLLNDLYGLLEEADSRALRGHVGACPACQTAAARVAEQRQLLAVAARTEFPGVRFQPPADTHAAAPSKEAAPYRTGR